MAIGRQIGTIGHRRPGARGAGVMACVLTLMTGGCSLSEKEQLALQSGHPWTQAMRGEGYRHAVVEVPGEDTPFEVPYFRGEIRGGVPLLFIHGTPGGLDVWAGCIHGHLPTEGFGSTTQPTVGRSQPPPSLADLAGAVPGDLMAGLKHHFDVIALDLAGHGLSHSGLREVSSEGLATFIAAFMESIDVGRAVVIGHSYGAEVAWRLAATHPGKVSRLVLIDSSGFPRHPDQLSDGDREAIAPKTSVALAVPGIAYGFVSRDTIARDLAGAYSDDHGVPTRTIDLYELYTKTSPNLETMLRLTRHEVARDDERSVLAALSGMKPPVLLVWGREDEHYTIGTQAARFAGALPNAKLVVVTNARHNVHEEFPGIVNAVIRTWIADRPLSRRAVGVLRDLDPPLPDWLDPDLTDNLFLSYSDD